MAERRTLTPDEQAAARALADAMAANNWTAEALGPAIGLTAGAVGHWTRAELVIPLDRVGLVAAKVGVAPEAISVRWRQSVTPYLNQSAGARLPSQSARLDAPMIHSAYRMARGSIEARGDSAEDFDPATDELDATLLALALEDVIENGIGQVSDGDVLRFARKVNKAGAKSEYGSDRQDGGTGGAASQPKTRAKGKTAAG